MKGEWTLYEELLAQVPKGEQARACLVGRSWTLVETSCAVGMAMTIRDEKKSTLQLPLAGRSLRDLGGYLMSWSLSEACVGLAAVNAHFNTPEQVRSWLGHDITAHDATPVFAAMEEELAGKKVAVIGHFPDLERLRERCELTVFERHPQEGDVPDFAEDYLLPSQEYVFITGVTLTNKTLPHLLATCANAFVVLVGPSVPLTPLWFDWGVDMLAGTVVIDGRQVWQITQEGGCREVWSAGAVTVQVRADSLTPVAAS